MRPSGTLPPLRRRVERPRSYPAGASRLDSDRAGRNRTPHSPLGNACDGAFPTKTRGPPEPPPPAVRGRLSGVDESAGKPAALKATRKRPAADAGIDVTVPGPQSKDRRQRAVTLDSEEPFDGRPQEGLSRRRRDCQGDLAQARRRGSLGQGRERR